MVECLAAILALVLLLALLILSAGLKGEASRAAKVNCLNNLKQIGIDNRIWEGDHSNMYSRNAPANAGSSHQLLAAGDIARYFQSVSNLMGTPRVLYCPADKERTWATNFASLSRSNICYFVSLSATEADPQSILAGDANLVVNGRRVPSGIFTLWTNDISWTRGRHDGRGNVLIADGSVQAVVPHSAALYFRTNTIVVP